MSSQWGSRNWSSVCRSSLAWKNTSFKGRRKECKKRGEVWEKFFDKLSSLSLIPINSLLQLMSQFFCLHLSHTNTHLHFLRFFSYIISKNLLTLICQLESCFFITSVVLLLCLNFYLGLLFQFTVSFSIFSFPIFFPIFFPFRIIIKKCWPKKCIFFLTPLSLSSICLTYFFPLANLWPPLLNSM